LDSLEACPVHSWPHSLVTSHYHGVEAKIALKREQKRRRKQLLCEQGRKSTRIQLASGERPPPDTNKAVVFSSPHYTNGEGGGRGADLQYESGQELPAGAELERALWASDTTGDPKNRTGPVSKSQQETEPERHKAKRPISMTHGDSARTRSPHQERKEKVERKPPPFFQGSGVFSSRKNYCTMFRFYLATIVQP